MDFMHGPIWGHALCIVTLKRTIISTCFNYFATWYSESSKRRGGESITLLAKSTHSLRTDERASMGNRDIWCWISPLFTVGCLNKRVQKLESSIMTHNPKVFEMEQRDLLWKRIGDVLCAQCLYLDVIWTEIQKKTVYLFFPIRP